MKKSFILMLSVMLTVGMLGCGNSQESKKTSTEPVTTTNTEKDKKQDKDTITIDGKEVPKIIEGNNILIDNDKYTITYTGIDNTSATGALIKLSVENKTENKITVQTEDISIGNEMIDNKSICSIDVTPGKKSSGKGINIIGSVIEGGNLKVEGTFVISTETDKYYFEKEKFSFEI